MVKKSLVEDSETNDYLTPRSNGRKSRTERHPRPDRQDLWEGVPSPRGSPRADHQEFSPRVQHERRKVDRVKSAKHVTGETVSSPRTDPHRTPRSARSLGAKTPTSSRTISEKTKGSPRSARDRSKSLETVREMVELKNKLSSLREENRKLRQQMHKKKMDSGESEAEQDRSLYNLLQEYMMENQSLRTSNKELRQKALSESKISMKNSISTEIPQLKESSGSSPEPSQSISTRMSSKLSNRTVTSEVSTQTPVQPRHRSERDKKKTEQPAQKPKKAGYSDLYEKRKPSSDIDFHSLVPPLKLNQEHEFGKNELPHPLLPNHPQINRHYPQGYSQGQNNMPIPGLNTIPQGTHHNNYNAASYHPNPLNYQQPYPPPNYYPFAPVPPRPGQQGPAYMSDPMRSYRMSQRDADNHLHQGRSTYRPERQHQQQRQKHHY